MSEIHLHRATSVAPQMQALSPGNRVLSPRDLAAALGSTPQWWERQRPRLVKAGLLVKAGRKFVGDLSKIQAALADPNLWGEASE